MPTSPGIDDKVDPRRPLRRRNRDRPNSPQHLEQLLVHPQPLAVFRQRRFRQRAGAAASAPGRGIAAAVRIEYSSLSGVKRVASCRPSSRAAAAPPNGVIFNLDKALNKE
jgi:hypothetical protein